MPSGWEKAPEYGGGPWGPWHWITSLGMLALVTFGLFACNSGALTRDAATAESAQAEEADFVGIASVTDGDSIEIHGQRIRLWGIDAPESAQQCTSANGASEPAGRRAATALADIIASRTVSCVERDRDQYGRPVSVCRVGEQDISRAMVEQGWAWAYVRYSRDYVSQEQTAREAQRGVWAWTCQAPWDYRAERRRR